MALPTIPGVLITAGSVVIAYLASWLKSDGLPQRTNVVIGWIAVIILAALTLWLTGNFTSNIAQDLVLVAVSAGALSQQLISLLQTAQKTPSPLLPQVQPAQAYKPLAAGSDPAAK